MLYGRGSELKAYFFPSTFCLLNASTLTFAVCLWGIIKGVTFTRPSARPLARPLARPPARQPASHPGRPFVRRSNPHLRRNNAVQSAKLVKG